MYKSFIFFGLLSLAAAGSIGVSTKNYGIGEEKEKEFVTIVKSAEEKQPDGSFSFAYQGADGSFREEVGKVINPGTDDEELVVHGTYRYVDENGEEVVVKYTAGKHGFVPEGTNIPKEISLAAAAAAETARLHPEDV
ncbi:endocuticle structural glycoprotein ABD-5-like [Teleopsis dalmanni]|uniref:endocuticle structural glycoprotein ABD-5-like n=1 Tax=Teleopsis dalmanni TaxID=139649 RepID=UPI0018CCCF11|nr:endocuticle structural glycoprotein ABD-5-like [Teleopsis dalmanni]